MKDMRERSWTLVLVLGTVLFVVGAALGPAVQGALAVPMGLAAVFTVLRIAKRSPGPVRSTWRLFSIGGICFVMAGVVRVITPELAPGLPKFPSIADLVVAIGYLALILGTYRMGHIRSGRDRAAHLDGLIVAISAATVVWSLVLWHYMVDP